MFIRQLLIIKMNCKKVNILETVSLLAFYKLLELERTDKQRYEKLANNYKHAKDCSLCQEILSEEIDEWRDHLENYEFNNMVNNIDKLEILAQQPYLH